MDSPFQQLGGEDVVRRIATAFYDHMEAHEPALARLHRQGSDGHVHPEARERFSLFLIGWLGGPQIYMEQHGHPRLRLRHAAVPMTKEHRDAWMRAMVAALDAAGVTGNLRLSLEEKFGQVADFLIR